MDERRQLPRWEIKKEVKVWLPGMLEFNYGYIEDMHLKGMCIFFNRPLPQQRVLKLSIALGEDPTRIKIEARKAWDKEELGCYVYGFAFNNIEDQDKDRLYQYINTNCFDQLKEKWWGDQ